DAQQRRRRGGAFAPERRRLRRRLRSRGREDEQGQQREPAHAPTLGRGTCRICKAGRVSLFGRLPGPWRTVVDWAVTILVAVVVVLAFEAEVAKPYRIPSSSMEPTLHCAKPAAGCESRFSDRVIACEVCYRVGSPSRGQIVVFHSPPAAKRACTEGGVY